MCEGTNQNPVSLHHVLHSPLTSLIYLIKSVYTNIFPSALLRLEQSSLFISTLFASGINVRMYLWWSLCTLYLHACWVRVTVGDSGLCCCVCVTYFDR